MRCRERLRRLRIVTHRHTRIVLLCRLDSKTMLLLLLLRMNRELHQAYLAACFECDRRRPHASLRGIPHTVVYGLPDSHTLAHAHFY